MKQNNWVKTLDDTFSYMEWSSIRHSLRTAWEPLHHSNTAYELHIILEGSCQLEVGEAEYTLHANEAILIRPNIFHCCRKTTEPFLRLTTSFLPRNEQLFSQQLESREDHICFAVSPAMRQVCASVFDEIDGTDMYLSDEMLSALFSQLMVLFLRTVQHRQDLPVQRLQTDPLPIIDRYFSSLHLQGDLSRKGLSQLLHCSERQLNRLMQELYGMTFQEKRLQARMDYAKSLLRNTDLKISQISDLVGYTNETSFYKSFRGYSGMTPVDFRRKAGKG